MLYQTIPQLVAPQIEHGPWARNLLFIKFLTLTHSSSPIGPYTILPLLIASPSSWCAPSDHGPNIKMREIGVATDPELIAVGMGLQYVGYLVWRESHFDDVGCATSKVQRPSDTTDTVVVRRVAIPGIYAHGHRPDRRSEIAQNATKQDCVGDQVGRRSPQSPRLVQPRPM